ncbi:hypothetical protein EMCRGX_G014665 [Ephydatia muelleri]
MPASRNPVIDLQMPASVNLAVNRNINQFQRPWFNIGLIEES